MKTQLKVFLGLLLLLSGVSGYLWRYGKPQSLRVNPLLTRDLSHVNRIVLNRQFASVVFQKNANRWEVEGPIHDFADPTLVEEIVAGLKSFSLGSVISENAEKWKNFEVDTFNGLNVIVFEEANKVPVLDALIGKDIEGFRAAYFRMNHSTPVYMVTGLNFGMMRMPGESFRSRKIFEFQSADSNSIAIVNGKNKVAMVRSSDTWKNEKGSVLASPYVAELFAKIDNFIVPDFPTENELKQNMGFEKPFATLLITVPDQPTVTAVLGKLIPKDASRPYDSRYVKISNRPAIILIREDSVSDFFSYLKDFPSR